MHSRQASSNNSEGNNRESSLDDSGVVDDHEEGNDTSEDVAPHIPSVVRVSITDHSINKAWNIIFLFHSIITVVNFTN